MKNLVKLNDDGWYWPIADAVGRGGAWLDLHDIYAETPEKVAALCKNKNVIVQAGGNCGLYIKKYAKLFKNVYTFEPNPVNFYCLNLNVTEENVIKFQAALGNERTLISLDTHRPDNIGAYRVEKNNGFIPTLKIDDLGLTECDVIQLDIEGYEFFALCGAENTLKNCRPIVILEFGWEHRYNVSRDHIDKYLSNLNYEFGGDLVGSQADKIYYPK